MPTSPVSKENLECTYLQRKVFKMGLWVCQKCPLYTKGLGEL
jgi:ribosomal protein L37AE/L43A